MKKRQGAGFSLMELMIVVAIIGLLAAIALPSYQAYVLRTKRTIGTALLTRVAGLQEQFYLDNRQYADDLTELGYPANPFYVDENNNTHAASTADTLYQVTLNRPTVSSYTLSAVPQGGMATQDTMCATLTLDHRGTKGESGTGSIADCW